MSSSSVTGRETQDGQVQLFGLSLAVRWVELGAAHLQSAEGVSSDGGVHPCCRSASAGLTTWRSVLLVGDPRCTFFTGAAFMPVANGETGARRLQLQRQSGQSTVVPSASVPKCCRALPSAAKRKRSPRLAADKNASGQPQRSTGNKCTAAAAEHFAPLFFHARLPRQIVRAPAAASASKACHSPRKIEWQFFSFFQMWEGM